ncbi:MAG: hydrolase [Thermoproteus sp. JCHS_4]|jgi:ADP-ribose pyrophosphatase|nr:MAG: hydrolase [Thermoproteus sp. JCHS_4]
MEEVIYRGRKFSLVRRARNVGGRLAWGEYLVHPGAVAVLALVDGEALLVRQFRGALGGRTLEIPAGTLEPGESPEETAARELVEETGYKPLRLEPLLDFYPTPGVSNERIWLFFADRSEHVGIGGRDADEADMEVLKMRPRDVLAMIDRGEIKDGKTVLAFLAAHRRGLI